MNASGHNVYVLPVRAKRGFSYIYITASMPATNVFSCSMHMFSILRILVELLTVPATDCAVHSQGAVHYQSHHAL
jgi:hypothetical protein